MAASSNRALRNRKAHEVVTLFLGSMVLGLIAGDVLVMLGMTPLSAVVAGSGVLAGAFGLGLTAVSYIRGHGD